MAFFDRMGKKLSNAGQSVAQQTKNLSEISRLNSQISAQEKRVTELYTLIGQAYYEQCKDGPEVQQNRLLQEIKVLRGQISAAQERILQLRSMGKCPQCGADVPPDALFCSVCGFRLEPQRPEGQPFNARCARCGAELAPDSVFCTVCGLRVAEPVPMAEPVSMAEPAPEEEPAPMEESTLAAESVPVEEPAPVPEPVPMEEPIPAEQDTDPAGQGEN